MQQEPPSTTEVPSDLPSGKRALLLPVDDTDVRSPGGMPLYQVVPDTVY